MGRERKSCPLSKIKSTSTAFRSSRSDKEMKKRKIKAQTLAA